MKKFLILFALSSGILGLIDACCGHHFPYFDYKGISVSLDNNPIGAPYDTMTVLAVAPTDVEYVAGIYLPTVTTPSYGTSCPYDGAEGAKYPIQSIAITADKAFDAAHPAGALLNPLFYYFTDTLVPLDSLPLPYSDFYISDPAFRLFTPFSPTDTSQFMDVTVTLVKANGQAVSGTAQGVKFK